MEAPLESPAQEITRLRVCLNDLARITALPVLSTGGVPSQIASAFLDLLIRMLPLSFAFIRLNDPEGGPSVEMARVAEPSEDLTCAREIGNALVASMGDAPLRWPPRARVSIGNVEFCIASAGLGLPCELGVVVAGSRKLAFPEQTEAVLLAVAANQVAIALQQERLLIAQRTRELASAEDEAEKSERESWRIIDSIPGFVALLTKTGEVDMVNRHLIEYFGATIEEIRQWGTNGMVHPEDLPNAAERFARSIDSGTPYESEHRLRRSDGVYRWFQSRGSPLRDANGHIVSWCWLLTDIDDRKRAEEAIRASERNLKLIIDTIPAIAWSAHMDGSADFFSQYYLDYVGLSLAQLKDWGWMAAVHPDDLEALVATWKRLMASEQAGEAEARLRRFDGSYRWFLFRANPLRDESGKIVKWYGANLDIEDRKRGEDALRARELSWRQIVDNIPGLVATTSGMGEVEFLNRQILEYFGKTSEDLKDWALTDAVHPDDFTRVVQTRIKSIETGQIYDVEHRCRRADGVYRWFQVRGLPVRNEEGTITDWYLLLTDIDDRKKAEEALRASELDVRSFFDNMPGFLARLSPDGTPEIFNRPFRQYLGKTAEEIGAWRAKDIVHPDDLAHTIEVFGNGISRGQPFELEYRLGRLDGVYRWFQARGIPVRNVEGRIIHWNSLITDIDDRKKAEEALRASEHDLRVMIDAIPTLVGALRPDGSVLHAGKMASNYTGLNLENMREQDARAHILHPEDVKRLRDDRRLALRRAVPFENEQRVRGKDGKYRWFLFRYNPLLDEQGRIDRWYVAAFDIEDRKRAEDELRRAYNSFADAQRLSKTGSFITDLVGDDHNLSEEALRIFEFDPRTKITVQMIQDMVHPDDLSSFEAMLGRAMTGVHVNFEFRIVTATGAIKHVRGVAHIIEYVEGRPLFVGALQDVTESKLAEEALDRARSELAHVARITSLNALTASIAHEVNQPLAGIITNAGTCLRMLDGDPPNVDGARETARRTLRDGNRAADVIKRLRALYSKKEFTLEPVDLNEATREVIALSLSDLQRNRVVLRSELFDDLPPVTCDRVQVQQVVLNLIRNATDAMVGVEDRPRQLLIRTEREDGDRVRVTVRDAGVGLDRQSMEKLFDAFYTTKTGGMGIGLSVSHSIIERHHGRLWAEPNEGPGATFSFSIPFGGESVADTAHTGRNS